MDSLIRTEGLHPQQAMFSISEGGRRSAWARQGRERLAVVAEASHLFR
jgi:hypothetical protein